MVFLPLKQNSLLICLFLHQNVLLLRFSLLSVKLHLFTSYLILFAFQVFFDFISFFQLMLVLFDLFLNFNLLPLDLLQSPYFGFWALHVVRQILVIFISCPVQRSGVDRLGEIPRCSDRTFRLRRFDDWLLCNRISSLHINRLILVLVFIGYLLVGFCNRLNLLLSFSYFLRHFCLNLVVLPFKILKLQNHLFILFSLRLQQLLLNPLQLLVPLHHSFRYLFFLLPLGLLNNDRFLMLPLFDLPLSLPSTPLIFLLHLSLMLLHLKSLLLCDRCFVG